MKRTEPIRDIGKLKELLSYYKKQGEFRNHVLVNLGVYTALRISDILKLRTNDVYDFKRRTVKETITIKEKRRASLSKWRFLTIVHTKLPKDT